ncbi:MAG TPA: beta-ketoacyl synthase, partial [Elusimicrobia bacterium]|nr:beta-ketoacyl synthase [Elusimicrobiota bacterium]
MNAKENPALTPIAIVGIGCLFPKAENSRRFWANIKNGVDAITEVPASHWLPEDHFDKNPKKPDMTYAHKGGFLLPVDFDPSEFGLAPNALEATDSAQLLGLLAAKMALEDAGYGQGREFDRSRVSVILGVTGALELVIPLGARLGHPKWRKALSEFGITGADAEAIISRMQEDYVPWQESSFPGLLGNVVSGRIANRFNLGGTNCVVDAACGSSLASVHMASLELASGRSSMVVTGGVDCFNDIFMYMCFSK